MRKKRSAGASYASSHHQTRSSLGPRNVMFVPIFAVSCTIASYDL